MFLLSGGLRNPAKYLRSFGASKEESFIFWIYGVNEISSGRGCWCYVSHWVTKFLGSNQTAPTGLPIGFDSLPVTKSHGLLSNGSYGANKERIFIIGELRQGGNCEIGPIRFQESGLFGRYFCRCYSRWICGFWVRCRDSHSGGRLRLPRVIER